MLKRAKWLYGMGHIFGDGHMCHGQKSRFLGDGHPTFNRNPYNGYINPYYWVDHHPLLYGNNGNLDPGTYYCFNQSIGILVEQKLLDIQQLST